MDRNTVFVEAPARLHFGFLDLRGSLGRVFGGIGAAAPAPSVLLSASVADRLDAFGEDAERAAEFGRRFMAHHGISGGARMEVRRAIRPHAGLGSGTQLALAVARALAELYALPVEAPALAGAVGRARRSAVGMWTFGRGGFVVEGGRPPGREAPGPLVARLPFPPSWRCVIAVPSAQAGLSGADEAAAFAALPDPPDHETARVSHLLLMVLLPALAEADLPAFGAALTEIQQLNGRWFSRLQGGTFAAGQSADLVRHMAEWGAAGVGQSSWGPAVYGIVDSAEAGRALADRARTALGESGVVYDGRFSNDGARVWRE